MIRKRPPSPSARESAESAPLPAPEAGPGEAAHLLHDLRNLLQGAHSPVEFLELEITNESQRQRLRAIRQSISFAGLLCENYLAAAATGRKAAFEEVDLGTAATSATAAFRAQSGDGVQIQFAGPPERVLVRGRPSEVERSVLNLMWNALEAMNQAQVTEPRLDLSWGRNERGAFFEVRDYGPGLPDGKLGQLAQPFRSSHGGGPKVRGLGLAFVKEILQEHHGRLESGMPAAGPGAVLRLQFGVQRELEFGQ